MGTGTPVTEDEIITPEKMNLKLESIADVAGLINRWTRPSSLIAADNVTIKPLLHSHYTHQYQPANGDLLKMWFLCEGNETKLHLGSYGTTISGKFDLYINGVLDSGPYDDYLATAADVHRFVSLTQPIKPGVNEVTLHINGKNASSTDYYLIIYGASLQ